MKKTIVLSLGGSLIVPDSIDSAFLKSFKAMIEQYIKKDYRFIIVCGGGKTARKYQEGYKAVLGNDQVAMDWIGIAATYLNAYLVRFLFKESAYEQVVSDPTKTIKTARPIIIASGWKPGRSTDYDATLLAKKFGAKQVINMSNIDYLYESDPKKNPNAKKIEKISWKVFREMIGSKWSAGLNAPFDPIAAKLAQQSAISTIIIGKDLKNLQNIIEGKPFRGTIISGR